MKYALIGSAALIVATLLASPSAAEPDAVCDNAAMSGDLGQALNGVRCYPGWAYVTNGELGDSTSLVRLVDGTWVRYTGFPSSISRSAAMADGVPAAELSSFRP